jgi:ketosteroid isomerase-like protein
MAHEPDTSTNPNSDVLRRAMAGISALDGQAVLACLHEDAVFELPYEDGVPDLDKAGFGALLKMMFEQYRQFTITLTHIYDLTAPDALVARYEGDCIGRGNEVSYANNYVGFFAFTDGLISSWREYDNPNISAAASQAMVSA